MRNVGNNREFNEPKFLGLRVTSVSNISEIRFNNTETRTFRSEQNVVVVDRDQSRA